MRNLNFIFGILAMAAVSMAAGCSSFGANAPNSSGFLSDGGSESGGRGGSMARFTIAGDYLYTVNDYELTVVSLADPARPVDVQRIHLGMSGVETIFPMDSLLFIGSQGAMFIYDISRPEFPKQLSVTSHFRSCDPVVAADTLAFVTLNSSSGNWCGPSGDVLQAYDISDLYAPQLICEVPLQSPRGLAVDPEAGIVFVCDGGVKAYDTRDPHNIEGLYTTASVAEVRKIDAYDCILWQGRLIVIGSDGLYQLGYDRDGFTFISKIDLRPR